MEKRTDFNTTTPATPKTADQKESVSHKVGDRIEKMGQKISNAGAEKLGEAIKNAGDKIEHMNDKKRP